MIATLESYEQKYGIVSQEVKPQTQADKLDMATDLAFDLDEFSVSTIRSMRHSTRSPTNRRSL